jgi:hypothetical protein
LRRFGSAAATNTCGSGTPSAAVEPGTHLEANIHGMKPEGAAVTAFLRFRLGEMAEESRAA